jgi:hypothetical protein
MSPLLWIVVIVAVLLLFGGGYGRWGGNPAYASYGMPGIGLGGIILIIVVVLLLSGRL